MLKVVILTRRRADLSREEFARHLRDTHLPLVARLPGLRRLVANSVYPDHTGAPPEWDAIGEDWFDSAEAWPSALASPAGQAVIADSAAFADLAGSRFLLVEEEEVALPAYGGEQHRDERSAYQHDQHGRDNRDDRDAGVRRQPGIGTLGVGATALRRR